MRNKHYNKGVHVYIYIHADMSETEVESLYGKSSCKNKINKQKEGTCLNTQTKDSKPRTHRYLI